MKTFAITEKQSAPAARKTSPYVHHPMGPAQQEQQAEIHAILHSTGAQAKLTIGQPNDKYEQEADRVADQVMRMSDADVAQRQPENKDEEETVQAKPLADQITPLVQRQEEVPEEEEELQAKSKSGETPAVTSSLESRIQAMKGGGHPLPSDQQTFFGPRMGRDFGSVRIHTDSEAADTAQSINSRAFTLGTDIIFNSGQSSLGSQEGKKLLAHELTHVVQQSAGPGVKPKGALPLIAGGRSSGTVQRQAATPEDRSPLSSPKLARLLGHIDLIGFDHNHSELKKEHRKELTDYARTILNLLRDYPSGVVTVTGHCDASGVPERNDPLGLARAEAAKAFLVTAGVDAERIVTSTRGEKDLRVQTQGNEPRNRRVEIRFHPTPMSLGIRGLEEPRTGPRISDLTLPPDYGPPKEPPLTIKPPSPPQCPSPRGPNTGKRPDVTWSYGFPLTLEIIVNPQLPMPIEAQFGELFTKHGLHLTGAILTALLEGRSDGVDQLETIILTAQPALGQGCARAFAEMIADALMVESLGRQLGREQPGPLERDTEQSERMRELMGVPDRGPGIQGGCKLIVHF